MRSVAIAYSSIILCSLVAFSADAEWGHMGGRFVYDGELPSRRRFEITKDVDAFGKTHEDESLMVNRNNKGLANVVIYLLPAHDQELRIHPSYSKDAGSTVTMEISRGQLSPRVVLARTTQSIVERNHDKVGHNTNIQSLSNPPRGALDPIGKPIEYRFPIEERVPMVVSCNIHPWERAFIVVRSNPYMAKTDSEGSFEIRNLPDGEHTFQVWHERIGYVRDIRCGPVSTDSKGRFSITIHPGKKTTLSAAVPGSIFQDK